jgi:hypothetical protein
VIVNDSPAIVSWAVRAAPVLASTLRSTVPPPLPLSVSTCTQGCVLPAVHPHPESTETRTDTRPPAAATFSERELSSYTHGAGSCRTLRR